MSKSKHTPGPWVVGDWIRSQGGAVYRQIKSEKRRLASVSVFGYESDGSAGGRKYTDHFGTERNARVITEAEADANAALIARAPELLAEVGRLRTRLAEVEAQRDALVDAAAAAADALDEEVMASGDYDHPTIKRHGEISDRVRSAIAAANATAA